MDYDSFEFALKIGNENSIWMMERALFQESEILDDLTLHGCLMDEESQEVMFSIEEKYLHKYILQEFIIFDCEHL